MRQTLEGLAILALGGFGVWGASLVPPPPVGETWAGVLPMGAALLLLAAGAGLAASAVLGRAEGGEGSPFSRDSLAVLGLVAVSLAYHAAIVRFGYELPTAIAAPLALWLFGMRRPLGLVLAAVLCPAVFHLVFFVGLGVFPPFGEVFDLVDWLRG